MVHSFNMKSCYVAFNDIAGEEKQHFLYRLRFSLCYLQIKLTKEISKRKSLLLETMRIHAEVLSGKRRLLQWGQIGFFSKDKWVVRRANRRQKSSDLAHTHKHGILSRSPDSYICETVFGVFYNKKQVLCRMSVCVQCSVVPDSLQPHGV